MSDVVTNADGTPRLINCKLYIPAVGKTVSMDLPVSFFRLFKADFAILTL